MDFRERELNCPACGSADTKLFVHPTKDDIVHVDGMYLAMCKTCDHVFSLDQRGAELLSAALPFGTSLHITTLCPNCKYNLKTRRIGDCCPECGEVIPRLVQRFNAEKSSGTRAKSLVAGVFLLTLVAYFFVGPALFPKSREFLLILAFAVFVLTICGLNIREYWMIKRRSDDGVEYMIDFPASSLLVILGVVAFIVLLMTGYF